MTEIMELCDRLHIADELGAFEIKETGTKETDYNSTVFQVPQPIGLRDFYIWTFHHHSDSHNLKPCDWSVCLGLRGCN